MISSYNEKTFSSYYPFHSLFSTTRWNSFLLLSILSLILLNHLSSSLVIAQNSNNCPPAVVCLPLSPSSIPIPEALYNLTFSSDPRLTTVGASNTPAYSWTAYDSNDLPCNLQTYHTGLLNLSAPNSLSSFQGFNYVNLSTSTGRNSIGSVLPLIGGASPGNLVQGTAGWSFEVIFKAAAPPTTNSWSKIFDFGNTHINGHCVNDIELGWDGTLNNFIFTICDNNGNQYSVYSPSNSFFSNIWYHLIIVVQETITGTADYFIFTNGSPSQSVANNIYPVAVSRVNAVIGYSLWDDDLWSGLIDTFRIYNYALTPAQVEALYTNAMGNCPIDILPPSTIPPACPSPLVTCPASFVPVIANPPIYTQTFANDPRILTGYNSLANYSWVQYDMNDANCTYAEIHTGLLSLGGPSVSSFSSGPYADVSAPVGPSSLGYSLPIIGGSNAGIGSVGTSGWSFEVTFKATETSLNNAWAKLFDIGNPLSSIQNCEYDIAFGWLADLATFQFNICDNNGYSGNNVYGIQFPYHSFFPNVWYHVVIVVQQTPDYFANYFGYQNGIQVSALAGQSQYFPPAVVRANGNIGKSNWGDPYFGGLLDTINIYNYALNPTQVNALFYTAMANCQTIIATPPIPLADYSFTSPSPINLMNGDPNYDWETVDVADISCGLNIVHTGLLVLGCTTISQQEQNECQYLNLADSNGPNAIGSPILPVILGQSVGVSTDGSMTAGWSFELTFKAFSLDGSAKLFYIGAPPLNNMCQYDIQLEWGTSGNYFTFTTCDGNGNQYSMINVTGNINISQWYHIVIVILELPSGSTTLIGGGSYLFYVNGVLTSSLYNTYYPPAVLRPNAYLGKSNSASESYWNGLIDSFRVYNQALSPSHITYLFNIAFTGSASGLPFSSTSNGGNCLPLTNSSVGSIISSQTILLSLNFSTDPRVTTGLSPTAAGYSWEETDPNDSAEIASIHQGLLLLTGNNNYGSFVNLSASNGPYSIGSTLSPYSLGGPGSGNVWDGSAGWSFEITYKPTSHLVSAAIFDFGNSANNPNCQFDILFSWDGSLLNQLLTVCDGIGTRYTLNSPVPLTLNNWYHSVIVIQLIPNGLANYYLYLDSVQIATQMAQYSPPAVSRYNLLLGLGLSNLNNQYWTGEIDSFNIYSQALNQADINSLYAYAMNTTKTPTLGSNQSPKGSNSSSSNLSAGAIVGIVIGVLGGVLFFCLLLYCCLIGRKLMTGYNKNYTKSIESKSTGSGIGSPRREISTSTATFNPVVRKEDNVSSVDHIEMSETDQKDRNIAGQSESL